MSEPIDLAALDAERFRPLVGQPFAIVLPEGTKLPLSLLEVAQDEPNPAVGRRAAFSLMFRCAALPPDQYIRQGCYRIENAALGAMEILVTPVTPDAAGMRYQAVFA
ncbi:MAG TPA: hypothetical protein VNX47_10940 [Nevskia sp.]|jgi:hypothetical protein|nr:hypothetical protein [Nevskia sp.]